MPWTGCLLHYTRSPGLSATDHSFRIDWATIDDLCQTSKIDFTRLAWNGLKSLKVVYGHLYFNNFLKNSLIKY